MSSGNTKQESPELLQRLIDWNADVLLKLLKKVVAKREATGKAGWEEDPALGFQTPPVNNNEIVDIIELPPFDKEVDKHPKSIEVAPQVAGQLKELVTAISIAYGPHAYHCLQHASQAAMAVTKLISRIAVSDFENLHTEFVDMDNSTRSEILASHLHNQTYGILSDPLTQFAVVFAALINDIDHRGITNEDLAKQEPDLAKKYGQSLSERLSVEKAWDMLMEPRFENLRRCLYADQREKRRLRQIMVNAVMATDKNDADSRARRQLRWDKSFGPGASINEDINRKATSVIECLMQSADIFHTMQHWHVYVKWNERGFEEATKAFKEGRVSTDPAKTWYKDELNHFDNYVIPLAMQLKDIDAFVVCSDEYLNYALKNRQRWASNGREIVAALVAQYTTGSATAKTDLMKAIQKEGKNEDATAKDATASKHLQRLVDWNNEVLERLIKQILAQQQTTGKKSEVCPPIPPSDDGKTIAEGVSETIAITKFREPAETKVNPSAVQLSVPVASQLKEYVGHVSSHFRDNSYHCLDRASQVSMTAKKLLGRLTAKSPWLSPEDVHKQSLGLASDPLAQFAVVFAALINDIDHTGIPNSQLVKQNHELAQKFKNRCITEQHSIDLAWSQIMQPEFEDLRTAICADKNELKRFRQLVVNAVLATNFSDEDLVALRKQRWEKAFGAEKDNSDLKATIAIVVLLQAADSFHAIQHWQMYQKWNERHFNELYDAFNRGRMLQDPSADWYKKELAYLDEHVIPLCEQMQQLGVFGNSADECLAFATTNREKWSAKGEDIVKGMVGKYLSK